MKDWIKVASVTTGGKSHFYVRYDDTRYPYRVRQSVCWDRRVCAWASEENDKTIGYYDNIQDAKRAF